ncbi:hypothetical protein V1291_005304 [Nitrobacteraceae bacterium AZCC 1564]
MNLTGGRTVLILNVCALILALIVSVEATFIDYRIFGWLRPSDWLFAFVPVTAMFLVRNKMFSIAFLSLYVGLAIQMCFQAWSLYSGTYRDGGAKDPLGYMGIFLLLSLVCLVAYGAFYLVDSIVRVCESIYR